MKIANKEIPDYLVFDYVNTISRMGFLRDCIEMYIATEKRRQEIHNKILDAANVSRSDEAFNLELAIFTEDLVSNARK